MPIKKVLIVDDEETNIALLRSLFTGNQYEIAVARDGKEGLAAAKDLNPDLILMDVMMPKMSGFKVCALLKKSDQFSHIPIIILSSRAGDDAQEISEQVGADTYMVKPVDKRKILAKINELLNWEITVPQA